MIVPFIITSFHGWMETSFEYVLRREVSAPVA